MTIEERAELAVETFAAGKGNCTQSVLCAWEDKIPVDHDTLMKLGAGYGAGMGCTLPAQWQTLLTSGQQLEERIFLVIQ